MAHFIHRGVIEGFYGRAYAHADRLWLIDRLGAWGMNRYVYAPKDDPLHRAEWRTPYPAETLEEFADLVHAGERAGVAVGFALSPGLSIEYSSAEDIRALQDKFRGFRALGSQFFCLALDDVPTRLMHTRDQQSFPSLAAAHVTLAHAVAEAIGPDSTLWVVPTDYVGVEPTEYLEELGCDLDGSIEVGWTGRTVVSPTITAAEAARRAETLRRRVVIWDNTPVADGPMRPMLHLGPYAGRDPALAAHASGVLLNPMQHAHASGVTISTAAAYMREPAAYDPEHAWQRALDEIGAGAVPAFALFAAAHRLSPILPADRDPELEAAVARLQDALPNRADVAAALTAIRPLIDARVAAAETIRAQLSDRALAAEIEPWLTSHHAESERMSAAADLLEVLLGDAAPMMRVWAFFRLEGTLTRIPPSAVASYGPRRVLYPQLGSLRDDAAAFSDDPALFVDRCLADDVVRLAEEIALAQLGGKRLGDSGE